MVFADLGEATLFTPAIPAHNPSLAHVHAQLGVTQDILEAAAAPNQSAG